jgi:DnaJ family protein C protein 8
MNLANEGLEAKKKDDEVAARKRKAEEDKQWEGAFSLRVSLSFPLTHSDPTENREQRVDSWRSFASKDSRKKKKAKVAILG